ncbi:MAG: pilus assembly protein PilP [Francisellaceae bacterium]|jgi:type IV pilus assembly protein PilP|nr:pilus assembly protein PilP [Francisellaceae bacterium]MBT6538445.1 pilus assembly protein PilP [Francisellaceae bacterium]
MKIKSIIIFVFTALLISCSGNEGDVKEFVAKTKSKSRGAIGALPEMKHVERVSYEAFHLRNPFSLPVQARNQPAAQNLSSGLKSIRDARRKVEYLEAYPLAALQLKGVIRSKENVWGLIQDAEGLMHKVQVGNYVGQNAGRIVDITSTEIFIVEKWDDGSGEIAEQKTSLKLVN